MNIDRSIGLDVGTVYIKAVSIDNEDRLVQSRYIPHNGDPASVLGEVAEAMEIESGSVLGITGSLSAGIGSGFGLESLDITRCQIRGVQASGQNISAIIDAGGASCSLIQLDSSGELQNYATNSLCAAGTGAFLDEQAGRLGIDYASNDTIEYVNDPPTIAARCSVFAKSDLIHRQQEGFSKSAMWSGLCRGMTSTMLTTLLKGRPLEGPTAVIGGVALNEEVLRWIHDAWPGLISVASEPHLVAAKGAALMARDLGLMAKEQALPSTDTLKNSSYYPWKLTLERSSYPSFETEAHWVDGDGNEVRIVELPSAKEIKVYIGIDIGSTSTKLVIIDENLKVLADIYRKTGGDPIGAVQCLFRALQSLLDKKARTLSVLGLGTTGSGRQIVGSVVGADAVINEISAHVAGASAFAPEVDTIFEIGGQDSKYMHVVNGSIRDSHMNYVCAAGTGSFVEEQANKLGFRVSEIGQRVLGTKPPITSDRCTVFMEQDVNQLIQAGATGEEAMASVMVSVAKNYLNKVVGNRYYNRKKVFFQGATARNPALVSAFEKLLGLEVVVSPYCHVMGAYGVALLAREKMKQQENKRSSFVGLDLSGRRIFLHRQVCTLCQNGCSITRAEIEGCGNTPSWGYMCGRSPEENHSKNTPGADLIRKRERFWRQSGGGISVPNDAPVIGIPQALTTYSYFPLWQRFFNALGFRVKLSGPTSEKIRQLGSRICGAEFCFPLKVALGHIASLCTQEDVDYVFVPQMTNEKTTTHATNSAFCPYLQAVPTCAHSALQLNGIDKGKIISPVVDMKVDDRRFASILERDLGPALGCRANDIKKAWQSGRQAMDTFTSSCSDAGKQAIAEARKEGKKLVVLIGRPYNNFDRGINLSLPEKLAARGVTVLPMDFLDIDLSMLGDRYANVYWTYGQKIIAALKMVAADKTLEAVYLTNFGCGPDSFLLSYASDIMGEKPFLSIEIDEHGGDAGYMTRTEAFLDIVNRKSPDPLPTRKEQKRRPPADFKDMTLWIPPMHPFAADLFAAAFQGYGYDARVLPSEDEESFELGRSVTRGSECLPTALTIGAFLKHMRSGGGTGKDAFLMATAQGPCRFGQYCNLHRQILDREGFADVEIVSPSSSDSYHGGGEELRKQLFKTVVVSDIIMKARCQVKPYEKTPGDTAHMLRNASSELCYALRNGNSLEVALQKSVAGILSVPVNRDNLRPLVGIVGEIYIRNNAFASENLIESIEEQGGEVWPTPLSEWFLYTSSLRNARQHNHKLSLTETLKLLTRYTWLGHWEKKLHRVAGELMQNRPEPHLDRVMDHAVKYMKVNVGGEAILTIGRTIEFAHQGVAMIVNCAPFGCMPGTVTTALFQQISKELEVPIVNMFYDGRGTQNQSLGVFLENASRAFSKVRKE